MKKICVFVVNLVLISLLSCNEKGHEVGTQPIENTYNAGNLNKLSDEEQLQLATKVSKSSNFKIFIKSLDTFNENIKRGTLRITLKDSSLVREFTNQLKNAKNDEEAKRILGDIFNDIQPVLDLYTSIRNNLNSNTIKKEVRELEQFSDNDLAKLYSKATNLIIKERSSRARTADCAGQCSEALNINMSWAQQNLYLAAGGCGLLAPTILGGLLCGGVSILTYYLYVNS